MTRNQILREMVSKILNEHLIPASIPAFKLHSTNIRELFQFRSGVVVGKDFSRSKAVERTLLGTPLAQPDTMAVAATREADFVLRILQCKTGTLYDTIPD